jgi:hypothetical protein
VDKNDVVKSFLKADDNLVLFVACLPSRSQQQTEPAAPAEAAAAACSIPPRSSFTTSHRTKDEPLDEPLSLPQQRKETPPRNLAVAGASSAERPWRFHHERLLDHLAEPSAAMRSEPREVQPVAAQHGQAVAVPQAPIPTNLASLQSPRAVDTSSVAAHANVAVKNEHVADPVFHHMEEDTQLPFDPEGYFNREPSPEQASQEEVKPTDQHIREIISQQDPQLLEAGAAQSIKVLQSLKQSFSRCEESLDARAWTEAIDKLIPQAERKRTVSVSTDDVQLNKLTLCQIVGVVGNTGAGKPSVINAMLDEERLVPTNCMRACTAVVTEMSWNDSTDPSSKYRAEIEFIRHEDWEKEGATLMKEFLTESGGISRDVLDENSDAGVAWAKFHSVYPKISRDSLGDCTVENLMSERSVLAVLGTTKKINTAYPDSFYQQLQRYVDSKEKVTKKSKDKDKDKPKKTFEMEFWPLIKVVKIYVKAPALSIGAVIVDLPGLHDSNAARAAVAQGYMKQCTGLWIVAPINRAVDDKAAKTLLGESFKRQLKYDGGFSSVTFICSKTDDISVTEAIDTLELEDEVEGLYSQQRQFEQEIETIKEKLEELQESREVYKHAQPESSNDIETWEELRDSLEDGKTVYAPLPKSKKRKKQSKQSDSRKKRPQSQRTLDNDFVVSEDESAQSESESDNASDDEGIQAPQTPLTEDDIKSKLKELREAKKAAR